MTRHTKEPYLKKKKKKGRKAVGRKLDSRTREN